MAARAAVAKRISEGEKRSRSVIFNGLWHYGNVLFEDQIPTLRVSKVQYGFVVSTVARLAILVHSPLVASTRTDQRARLRHCTP
jgi:hypothetical protein